MIEYDRSSLPEIGALLTTREVARLRGITKGTVANHVRLGTINPPETVGGRGRGQQALYRVDEKMLSWIANPRKGEQMTRRRVAALENIHGQATTSPQDAPHGDGADETPYGRVRVRVSQEAAQGPSRASIDVLARVRERLIYWRGFAEGTGVTYGAGKTLLKAVVDLEAAIGVGE